MKMALVTTTINVPHVLSLYRVHDPSVRFFVAGDEKTPLDTASFCNSLSNCEYYSRARQKDLGYACSPLLGWNTSARRSIAILEALKWGADVIVTIDDDNIPLDPHYFAYYEPLLAEWNGKPGFSGLQVESQCEPDISWFDPGIHLIPRARHRGLPYDVVIADRFSHITDARIGVAAGLCLGDPDIDATTRIVDSPLCDSVTEVARAGFVVPPTIHTVFNSQNTAFIRELAPCFLMVPQFGRPHDIFASLVAQRIMRERNLYTHFGKPFVWQQRNEHNLLKDLRDEQWGYEHILEFTNFLDTFIFDENLSSHEQISLIWYMAHTVSWMPNGVKALGQAWCSDCEKVL